MSKGSEKKSDVLSNVTGVLKHDERIQSIFLLGSLQKGKTSPVSDIDLWVILSEESGINTICKELNILFAKTGVLLGIYECTAHHYFIIYRNGVQVDLNFVTAASYWSVVSSKSKTVLFDRTLSMGEKNSRLIKNKSADISRLLLVGYTTLERGLSKFIKKDYFVVVRFLDAVRHNSIIPLLPFFEKEKIPNAVSLNIDNLSAEVKQLLIHSYAKPVENSCRESMTSTLLLLDLIAKKVNNNSYKLYSVRLNKLLK
jgi:predicted nucleotidyltransferase